MNREDIMPILRHYFVCEDEECLDDNIKALYVAKDDKTLFAIWEEENANLLMMMLELRKYIPNKSRILFDMYIEYLKKQGRFLYEKQKSM